MDLSQHGSYTSIEKVCKSILEKVFKLNKQGYKQQELAHKMKGSDTHFILQNKGGVLDNTQVMPPSTEEYSIFKGEWTPDYNSIYLTKSPLNY